MRRCYGCYNHGAHAHSDGHGDDDCDLRAGEEGEARSRSGGRVELWKDVMGYGVAYIEADERRDQVDVVEVAVCK
jgi:hypothetical protein